MGGHHHVNPEAKPIQSQDLAALAKAQVPIAYRDTCAHLLVPLNKCRRVTWWNPNKCEHERVSFVIRYYLLIYRYCYHKYCLCFHDGVSIRMFKKSIILTIVVTSLF